jgi:hypothetical protein
MPRIPELLSVIAALSTVGKKAIKKLNSKIIPCETLSFVRVLLS